MPTTSEPIWHRRWFQFLLGVLVAVTAGGFIIRPLVAVLYAARAVLVPMLVALALAYAVNPLVTWLQRRAGVPRPVTIAGIMLGFILAAVALVAFLRAPLQNQVIQLYGKSHGYLQKLAEDLDLADWQAKLSEAARSTIGTPPSVSPEEAGPALQLPEISMSAVSKTLLSALDIGYGVVTGTIGIVSYLSLFAIVLGFCFFFFAWKIQPVFDFFVPFIPSPVRQRTLEVLSMMNKTVSSFIRGRLIQSAVMATVLSVGWMIADVPYWLLLGIAGGLLNLVPYVAVIVWPLAMLLAYLDSLSAGAASAGFNYMAIIIWPSIVYFVAQGLDGWVVEPTVQGKATDLDPLTVLLCVLIGGSLLGLLGMLIAIPATACIKILMREVVLPKLRELAAER